jgi:hypothetical protein
VNTLPEAVKHPTRRDLHQAAVLAVYQSRIAKAQGDTRREKAWLLFAQACAELNLARLS